MLKKIVSIGFVPYVVWLIFCYQFHFIDWANLLFHEAGHVVLSVFGETAHFLAGSLGQLFFPTICCVSFLRKKQRFEAAVCGIWFAENLLNIAQYMSDAQVQLLPLVGGGIHDWHWLLSRAGLLSKCDALAILVHSIGSMALIGFLVLSLHSSFFGRSVGGWEID